MSESATIGFILVAFPLFFAVLWIAITTLLMALSGWFGLQSSYPDKPDDPLIKSLANTSGAMGRFPPGGVQFGFSLNLDVCQSGLRVRVWKILWPFARPIFVPWSRIETERGLLGYAILIFGRPEDGRLRVRPGIARKIQAASGGAFRAPVD